MYQDKEPMKEKPVEVNGIVTQILGKWLFEVTVDNASNHKIKAKAAEQFIKNDVKLRIGDLVRMEIDPYELGKGLIIARLES